MASAAANYLSAVNNKTCCVYCTTPAAVLRPGWRLRDGGPALLCDRCCSAYETGRFCDIFHLETDGWRGCSTCGKLVHCGCIMSVHTYELLDSGSGIKCTDCFRDDIIKESDSSGFQSENSPLRNHRDLQDSMEVGLSVNSDGLMRDRTSRAVPSLKDNPFPERRELPSADSPYGADPHSSSSKGKKPLQSDASSKCQSICRYTPKATEEALQQIQIDGNSVVPLFEKTLTSSDVNIKNGRMVIPKNCAKKFLPKLSGPEGFPMRIQDTSGKDWHFYFRIWTNNKSTMYVIEGLKDYLIWNQCQAGDKVTFYRVDPEEKLVMGLTKKAEPIVSVRKNHIRACRKNEKKKTSRSSK